MNKRKRRKYGRSSFSKLLFCMWRNGFDTYMFSGLKHNYREVKNGWNKKTKRYESVLRCKDCKTEDISWSNQPIY